MCSSKSHNPGQINHGCVSFIPSGFQEQNNNKGVGDVGTGERGPNHGSEFKENRTQAPTKF